VGAGRAVTVPLSSSMEDYLEVIHELSGDGDTHFFCVGIYSSIPSA